MDTRTRFLVDFTSLAALAFTSLAALAGPALAGYPGDARIHMDWYSQGYGPNEGAGLTAAKSAAGAVTDKGTGELSIIVDEPFYWQCAGQQVTQTITGTFSYHSVLTPSGMTQYHELWLKGITGRVEGADGTVWIRTGNVSPYVELRNADGTLRMVQFTFKGEFVSETAPTIKVWQLYHLTIDANGELRIELSESRCA